MSKIIFISAILLFILFPVTVFFGFGFRFFLPANVVDTRFGDTLYNTLMFWPIIAIFMILSIISAIAILKEKKWGIYLYNILSILLVAISSIFLIVFVPQTYVLPVPIDDVARGVTQDVWNSAISKSLTMQVVILLINLFIFVLGFIYLVRRKRFTQVNRELI